MNRITWRRRAGVFAAALAAACSTNGGGITPPAHPELDPFREEARTASCAEKVNRLFLIDGRFVLWHREGACPDASYAVSLFGLTPDEPLCGLHDSIGGPVRFCDEEHAALFDWILENHNAPDFTLQPDHTVEPIEF